MPHAAHSSAVVTSAASILVVAGARAVPLPDVTYFVVVPFTRNAAGCIVPGEAEETPSGEAARWAAEAAASIAGNVGAVAFSRSGRPTRGIFSDGVVLASFGAVDLNALQG